MILHGYGAHATRQRPAINTRRALATAEAACTRCPLYRHATQVVPGEGPARAPIMVVGEQPGDREDLEGRPFVGPAGRVLDDALADAGIDRAQTFVTNAVKHFKFAPRGKRRFHKRPNAYEIQRCRWWLDLERAIIMPKLIIAMGATAIRSVNGKPLTIAKARAHIMPLPDGGQMIATVHPSYLLRIPDEADKRTQYRLFVRDLKLFSKVT